ncbi:hypothetical protein ENSA5_36830 [Enhygromyxa salina]|uniref:Virginiamycin B lyase n=1 Tax=Enhygromyxa salina TaxID=215803 RepID=A0A2S9XSG9_9BACT|nr:hypothetical protein [Enhygromyxa salina]PRP95814.1 hypothetical protein ENSA5_36830 [Enhygromyxa salina]
MDTRTTTGLLTTITALTLAACSDDGVTPGADPGDADDGIFLTEDGEEGEEGEDGGDSGGDGLKLDVLSPGDGGENIGDCGGDGGGSEAAFSIIWIANSSEGTVSKVDTATATELARYRTGPGQNPNPSRTSVNLFGDVAVANRSGSVVKIAAKLDDCVDLDQDGVITTSEAAEDVLEWGEDECVLWHHEVGFDSSVAGHQGGPRAVAWDRGEDGPEGCKQDPKVWVGWRAQPDDSVIVRRLDGATGEPEGEVEISAWDQNWGHGTYGGATDKERNFWGLGTGGSLIKVDGESFEAQRWDNPEGGRVVYGIALDAAGEPWLAGWDGALWHFDVDSESWEDHGEVGEAGRLRGLAIDQDGHAWIAGNQDCGLIRYDTNSATVLAPHIELPGCDEPVGVSIDAEGFVWVVDRGANMAFRVDPDTQTVSATVSGFVNPYTYSDMTGAGLAVVVFPGVG